MEIMIDYILSFINRLVFKQSGKIRIDRDHLPGLRPPKPAPPLPRTHQRPEPGIDGPSIHDLYKRFVSRSGERPEVPKRPKDGDLF
jgi:hypothetical protein